MSTSRGQKVRLLSFAAALAVASCAAKNPDIPNVLIPAGARGGVSFEDDSFRLFEELASDIRRFHVFSIQTDKNLGSRWEDRLPALGAEFAKAKSEAELMVALTHFANSLHNEQSRFKADTSSATFEVGLEIGVEERAGGFDYYVSRVLDSNLEREYTVGDVVVSFDGIPANQFLRAFQFDSAANSKAGMAEGIARFLTKRATASTLLREGSTSILVVKPRDSASEKTGHLTWVRKPDAIEFPLDHENRTCAGAEPKAYGPYTLDARGTSLCIYTSKEPQYRDYPIVRHVAFEYHSYSDHDTFQSGALADYNLLKRAFEANPPKGVVLDVQDNRGSDNPHVFLGWWASRPYEGTYSRMVLESSLAGFADRRPPTSNLTGAARDWFLGQLHEKYPGQRLSAYRPYMCLPHTCAWDNMYEPAGRVTTAPVALLLGPGCAGTCDYFAFHFDRSDFGPIVGRPASGSMTNHRTNLGVNFGPHRIRLGTLQAASSFDSFHGTKDNLEGAPVHVDVPIPHSFESFRRYDQLLVNAAIEALKAGAHTKTP